MGGCGHALFTRDLVESTKDQREEAFVADNMGDQALIATLHTTLGPIVIRLFPDDAPQTVDNFVGLAEGTKEWLDPQSGQKSTAPLYNGTIFHRVIDGFMIQGGDPLGTGTGGPGYRFPDEFKSGRRFDRKYLLAMANSGPNTNGSQFFITVTQTPHLNNLHTIFGEVIEGSDIVDRISKAPTGRMDRPLDDISIESVTIERRGSS
jgi:peptidyl-prolyl cis-trans isomerase A (cyclophilin A)